MKGLYIVDADRGFVQHFENLIFTETKEYRMRGHNFKANEFLNKIKERPDLLGSIDLLFVNPKLNDLNGLELVKKVQSYRKDINICIVVNENIKSLYETEIAELGAAGVLVYPNSDEYYLNSIRRVFENIENEAAREKVGFSQTLDREPISDKDVFFELSKPEFLNQFDFDSLSNDMFGNKNKEREIPQSDDLNNVRAERRDSFEVAKPQNPNIERVEQNPTVNNAEDKYYDYKPSNSFSNNHSNENNFKNQREPINANGKLVEDFNTYKVHSRIQPSFVDTKKDGVHSEDNFGENDFGYSPKEYSNPVNNFGEPKKELKNLDALAANIPNVEKVQSPKSFDSGFNNPNQRESNFNSQPVERHQDNSFSKGLDLAAFGVNTSSDMDDFGYNGLKDNGMMNQKPSNGFNQNSHNTSNSYGEHAPSNSMGSNFNPHDESDMDDFGSYGEFDMNNFNPHDDLNDNTMGGGNKGYSSNLQRIDRPDIDVTDSFESYEYGQSNGNYGYNANSDYSETNSGFNNNFGYPSSEPSKQSVQTPRPNTDNAFGYGGNNDTQSLDGRGFSQTNNVPNDFDGIVSLSNPYEEKRKKEDALRLQRQESSNAEKPRVTFGEARQSSIDSNGDFGRFGENPSQGKPFGGNPQSQNNPHKSFDGFDFGAKPSAPTEQNKHNFDGGSMNSNFNSGYNNMGGMQNNGYQNNNVGTIGNMHKNTGVDDLNYNQMDRGVQQAPVNRDIVHHRSNDEVYKEIPKFAKQTVAFYSTKGGIGKTTVAINTTIQLAKHTNKKICIVDFDVTNANVHTHLGILDATYDLSVVANFESDIDTLSLSRIVTHYKTKDRDGESVEFDVIVGFREMSMTQRFNEKEVHRILSILEEMYDIVVVDAHPVYTDPVVSTILKKASKIVFVTEQDMTALDGARNFISVSKKYNIPSEKLFMVLNRYDAQIPIFTKKKLENALNKNVMATIPADMRTMRDSVNINMPVAIASPDSEITRAFVDVAKIIEPTITVREEPKGFFGRKRR